jgi:hypothetical protein
VFTVGAIGGLMTPLGVKLTVDGTEVPRESFEHARWIGERAASAALEALRSRPHRSFSAVVRLHTRSFFAPLGNVRFRAAAALGVLERPLFTEGRRDDGVASADLGGRTLPIRTGKDLQTEVGYFRMGDLDVLRRRDRAGHRSRRREPPRSGGAVMAGAADIRPRRR